MDIDVADIIEKEESETEAQTEQIPPEAELEPDISNGRISFGGVKHAIIFFSMLAAIVALTAAVAVLSVKNARLTYADGEPEANRTENHIPAVKYTPFTNNRTYEFFEEGDSVFFEDGYYGQVMLPAFTEVPKVSYDYSNLSLEENGRYIYTENGAVTSKTGIDVSYHQKAIDWKAVKDDGVDFAIIRVGYRGYETGLLNLDERFNIYMNGALNAGLDVGVYFYSQALTVDEAIEEAAFVINCIEPYDITYPVVFDWEITGVEGARTNVMSPETLTECAAAFCDTVADAGYIPMIYTGRKLALLKMDLRKLTDYDIWYCEYKDGYNPPEFHYDFQIWQYASNGRVNGVNGDVDLNISFVDYKSLWSPEE